MAKHYLTQNNGIEAFFSESCLREINNSNIGECLLCSVQFMGNIIPIICINLSATDISFFGIRMKPVHFNYRFRYLDYSGNELIEIQLQFKHERVMNLDLDPTFENVRHFLLLLLEQKNFAFFFYNAEKNILVGNFFINDEEELTWVKRNYHRANALQNNNFFLLQNEQIKLSKSNEKFYVCKNTNNDKMYINENSKLIPLEKACGYLGNINQE